jgi:hypothetical protein
MMEEIMEGDEASIRRVFQMRKGEKGSSKAEDEKRVRQGLLLFLTTFMAPQGHPDRWADKDREMDVKARRVSQSLTEESLT